MNPSANPGMMLPPQQVASMIRSGGTPGQIFQDNPLQQNMTPGAMGADPTTMNQPPAGSQAMNPTMPQGTQQPMPPVAPDGQSGVQPMSESEMILQALMKRLESHSKLTHKTVDAIIGQIEANGAMQPTQPTA